MHSEPPLSLNLTVMYFSDAYLILKKWWQLPSNYWAVYCFFSLSGHLLDSCFFCSLSLSKWSLLGFRTMLNRWIFGYPFWFEMNTWLQRMGNIDKAVPFFGQGFNRIYPLIMVIYTIMVASNFFNRIISFFGNWKIFRLQTEADDVDGFDPSGMLILQKGEWCVWTAYFLWSFTEEINTRDISLNICISLLRSYVILCQTDQIYFRRKNVAGTRP